MRLAILIFVLSLCCFAPAAPAEVLSSTTPAFTTQLGDVRLDDPLTPQAICYLDLDSGKTFTRADSSPDDFLKSRQWQRDSGVDILCETRAPADGFVAYGLALIEVSEGFDAPRNFDAVRDRMKPIDPQPFELVKIAESQSKTYLFRTAENVIGVVEIGRVKDSSALHVRYKHLHAPPPPPGRPGELKELKSQIEQQKALIAQLNPRFGANIAAAQRRLKMLEDQLAVESTEPDGRIASLKRAVISEQFVLDSAVSKSEPAIPNLKSNLQYMKSRIAVMDVTRRDWQVRSEALERLDDEHANRTLAQLESSYGPEHPEVLRARVEVAVRNELLEIKRSEKDKQLAEWKQQKRRIEYMIQLASEPRPLPFLKLPELMLQNERLTRLIAARQRQQAATATSPSTLPAEAQPN